MAESSWPSIAHPAVSRAEYEQLTHPTGGDGVVGTPADTTIVYADDTGLFVKFRANKFATIRGHEWTSGGSDFSKAVTSNASGLTRVDVAVLRLTRSTWDITAEVRAGIAGAGAPAIVQDLGTTGVFEIPVGYITIPSGDSSIGASQVTRAEYYLGEPLIVCTAATRPGHAYGRRIYETDTGLTYLSNGTSTWRLLQPPTFTSTTRPSHQAGLLIHETDTTRLVMSDGSAWKVIGDDSGVTSASLSSGTTATVNQLIRRNGWCALNMTIQRTAPGLAANSSAQIATVATGFKPLFAVNGNFAYPTGSGQSFRVEVQTDGTIRMYTPTGLQLNGERDVIGTLQWPVA